MQYIDIVCSNTSPVYIISLKIGFPNLPFKRGIILSKLNGMMAPLGGYFEYVSITSSFISPLKLVTKRT
jgi:hypothetical protein